MKRRLKVVKELCDEFGMSISIGWIESAKNKADKLTRVGKTWLERIKGSGGSQDEVLEDQGEEALEGGCSAIVRSDLVSKIHAIHHLGVDRTLYLARLEDPEVSRAEVQEVVSRCVSPGRMG